MLDCNVPEADVDVDAVDEGLHLGLEADGRSGQGVGEFPGAVFGGLKESVGLRQEGGDDALFVLG